MGVDYRKQYSSEQLEPFFPHEIIRMLVVVLCTLGILMFMVVLPMLLQSIGVEGISHEEQPADPSVTPVHIRPEWYFLSVYQYLKLMPAEILGMDGKSLGLFTQGIVMAMVLFLPFWFPLRPAQLKTDDWGRGLRCFGVLVVLFLVTAWGLAWLRGFLPEAFRDLLHPMYTWPVLAVAFYVFVGQFARLRGFDASFKWLKLTSIGLWLIGLQFLVFIVVLGQGLSWSMPAVPAYLIGGILFLMTSIKIIQFVVQRILGTDEESRVRLLTGFVTEGILAFFGLMIWAMWPAGGLYTSEHGWHHETGGLIFTLIIMAIAVVSLYAFLFTERWVVQKVLKPEDRDKIL